jgi:hypothetical protein
LVVVGLAIAALIVVVVIRSASSGDSPSHQLTVCESAWQEAQRSAAETGAERDNQLAIKPTLTACDTVAEWDAANIRVHSPLAEGASVVNGLCTKLGATTPLCAEAKQAATPST